MKLTNKIRESKTPYELVLKDGQTIRNHIFCAIRHTHNFLLSQLELSETIIEMVWRGNSQKRRHGNPTREWQRDSIEQVDDLTTAASFAIIPTSCVSKERENDPKNVPCDMDDDGVAASCDTSDDDDLIDADDTDEEECDSKSEVNKSFNTAKSNTDDTNIHSDPVVKENIDSGMNQDICESNSDTDDDDDEVIISNQENENIELKGNQGPITEHEVDLYNCPITELEKCHFLDVISKNGIETLDTDTSNLHHVRWCLLLSIFLTLLF